MACELGAVGFPAGGPTQTCRTKRCGSWTNALPSCSLHMILIQWLESHAVGLGAFGAIGAAISFVCSVWQFMDVRRREQRAREFEVFHRLIKDIVSPEDNNGPTWVDRQIAAVFELRHLTRYHEVAARILVSLREPWSQREAT